eukprot:maker-scaffold71_size417697-snap-gene-0.18 protein:Tk11798 transcript:maker-scaffold71_size417697-snap-gene-0.18-mRNA-1 annotation:"diacylglycerol kinase eta-like isoform x1"
MRDPHLLTDNSGRDGKNCQFVKHRRAEMFQSGLCALEWSGLIRVTSHGLSCGICKLKAHKSCVANILTVCKWSTLDTVDHQCITEDQNGRNMHHQWVEGNLAVSSKCVVCDKNCGSVLRLQDWRCLWCRATVHTMCRSSYIPHCSLGPTRHATVPPIRLIKND